MDIYLVKADGTETQSVRVDEHVPGGLSQFEFRTATILVSEFDTPVTLITGVKFQGEPQKSFAFDNMKVLKPQIP